MKSRNSILQRIFTIGIVLLPILSQYRIAGFSLLYLYSFITVAFFGISVHIIRISNKYWLYIIYTLFSTIFALLTLKVMSISLVLSNIFFMLLILVNMYILAPEYFDVIKGYKIYTNIIYIISVILLVQFILFTVKGIKTAFIIPGLELNYGGVFNSTEFIQQFLGYQNFRVSSIFIEPTMYAAYILPWIFISLFNTDRNFEKDNIIRVLVVTIIMCLSGSSYGILGAAIAWVLFIEVGIWKSGRKGFVFAVPIILLIAYWVFNLEIVQTQLVMKMGSLNKLDVASSTSLRLLRGWYCFKSLHIVNIIFGCGYGILEAFFAQNDISTIYDYSTLVDKTFMSSFFKILCQSGIVGASLYFIPIISVVKQYFKLLPIFICFVYTILTSSTLDMPSYFLQIVFMFSISSYGKKLK